MMRLWIDGQCLQTASRLRGIGRYVSELIRAIAMHCPQVEMSISFNAALPDAILPARQAVRPWIAPRNIHLWQGVAHAGERAQGYGRDQHLSEVALAHHMACLNPDIALSASPFEGQFDAATPLLTGAGHGVPRAAIFYDAIPHRYPTHYLTNDKASRYYRRRLAAHGDFDLLLAISDFARREAEDLLPDVKAVRIDAGVSPDFIALSGQDTRADVLAQMGVAKPFLLYVGGIDWRKNLAGLKQAWPLLQPALQDRLQLVMAGDIPPHWLAKFQSEWAGSGLPPANLVGLGHVSDENLVQLYKQANLVIQPSLMEGFGLTALEAMSCGAPVIAADAGALPEVVGDARALFDPKDPAAIAQRIAQFLSDPALAKALVEQGRRQAATFSWERTARLAVEAFRAAARSSDVQSLDTLRGITRAALGPVQNPDWAARILATAEPRPLQQPRLLIDVSHTAKSDSGTGIQRVVKGIAAAAMARIDPGLMPQLCFCDSSAGFFRAHLDGRGKPALGEKNLSQKLRFGPGDRILMLDSSWTKPALFQTILGRARLQGAEVVSVLYDLTPLKLPAFFGPAMPPAFSAWLLAALVYSSGFVCISRAVADEFLALLAAVNFPRPMKVGYWRLGADLPKNALQTAPRPPRPSGQPPLFLMVSTLEPRKGYRVALDAFTALWREGFDGTLCIIGRRGWAVDHLVADILAHPEFGKKLRWLENASDETLNACYDDCTALIAAAHAEGFGLPIVEAFQHGKPVIASDIPVFREVAGDGKAVTYFHVGSAEALADAVRGFQAHQGDGLIVSPVPVSWAQSAAQLEAIIEKDNWYRIYQPRSVAADVPLDAIGDWTPAMPQAAAGRRHLLELAEGPILINKGSALKYVVRVTNLGNAVWSSAGPEGVRLGVRLVGGQGEGWFSQIPLVHIPGETHTMALELPAKAAGRAQAAEIGLVQGARDWWDNPLRVHLG